MSDKLNLMHRILHDARIELLCKGLQTTRIDVKEVEIERLKQALHDARIENSGQAAELERLNEAKRWIPIAESSPELGVDVMVIDRGELKIAWRHIKDGEWSSFSALNKITHWMPLPEPPKEVQG